MNSNFTFTLDAGSLTAIAERVAEILREDGFVGPGNSDNSDKWLTTREAADYLAISVSRLHKLTAARGIPFHQDCKGGRCRFRRRELDEWMRSGLL